LTSEFKNKFWSNLKITLKFIGIVLLGLIVKIVIDEFEEDTVKDLTAPFILLAFIPTILLGVFTYTKLKISSLNKFVCSLIFAFVISLSILVMYFIGVSLGSTDINLRLAKFFTLIVFVSTAGIYLQLPWEKDA
jgi:small basic protein